MAQVKVRVIDITGKIVQEYRQGAKQTGRHKFILDGSNIASGEYICLFSAGTLQTSRKVTLLK